MHAGRSSRWTSSTKRGLSRTPSAWAALSRTASTQLMKKHPLDRRRARPRPAARHGARQGSQHQGVRDRRDACASWTRARIAGCLLGKGGLMGNVVRIAPPLSITKEQVGFDARDHRTRRSTRTSETRRAEWRLTIRGVFCDLSPPLDPTRAQDRSQPLLLLLRRSLHPGMPDPDRHPELHSQDRQRQRPRRRARHPERQHHGWDLRARLPGRDALPEGLRSREVRSEAGCRSASFRGSRPTRSSRRASSRSSARRRTAKRVAVVGAGPAGLSCAHAWRSRATSTVSSKRARNRAA